MAIDLEMEAKVLAAAAEQAISSGDYLESELLYRRALTILECALGSESLDVAALCADIARLYQICGRQELARTYIDRTERIIEKRRDSLEMAV